MFAFDLECHEKFTYCKVVFLDLSTFQICFCCLTSVNTRNVMSGKKKKNTELPFGSCPRSSEDPGEPVIILKEDFKKIIIMIKIHQFSVMAMIILSRFFSRY